MIDGVEYVPKDEKEDFKFKDLELGQKFKNVSHTYTVYNILDSFVLAYVGNKFIWVFCNIKEDSLEQLAKSLNNELRSKFERNSWSKIEN